MYKRFRVSLVLMILVSTMIILTDEPNLISSGEEIDSGEEDLLENPYLEDCPWPTSGFNERHTRLSPFNTSHNPGKFRWKLEIPDMINDDFTIGPEGNLYLSVREYLYNHLYSLYPTNGSVRWRYTFYGSYPSAPLMCSDGHIYITDGKDKLYKIDMDGNKVWSKTFGSVWGNPIIDRNGTIYVGGGDGRVSAIYPNGTVKWTYWTGDMVCPSPSIGPDGSIYVGSNDYFVHCIYPNGSLKWRYETNYVVHSDVMIDDNGDIYFNTHDGIIVSLNSSGGTRWTYDTECDFSTSPALGPDGRIYVTYYDMGRVNNNLIALDNDGNDIWKFHIDSLIYSTPCVSNDGEIFFGSGDKNLYCVYPNGTMKWKYPMGEYVHGNPAIDSDGNVYVIASFKLYSLGTSVPDIPVLESRAGDGFVVLTWEEPAGNGHPLESYDLYRGTSPTAMELYQQLEGNTLLFNDTDVTNDVTYYYYLEALNKLGPSGHGDPISARPNPPAQPPSAPVVSIINTGDRFILLGWEEPESDGGDEIIGYNIYRKDESGKFIIISSTDPTTNRYNDTGLENGLTYTYCVRALNNYKLGISSAGVSGVPECPPNPPYGLKPEPVPFGINLSWHPPDKNGGHEITSYRIIGWTQYWTVIEIDDTTSGTDHSVLGLDPNVTYHFIVKAVTRIGESGPSNEITSRPLGPPSGPTNVMADQKLGYNNITWRQPVKEGGSPISGYEIFRNGIPIGTTTASQKWFNDRSGSSFMNETYFVVALNIVGRGIPSFNVTATFMVPLPPPTGIDLEFYNGYVTLTWKRPDIPDYIEITGYKILRASSWSIDDLPLEKWQYLPIGDSTTGQYIDEDPVTGYLSAYRIIAYNELGMGERSDPSIIEIPTNPIPSIPLDLQYSIIKGGIYLRWGISDYTGPSDFQFSIYRSVEDGEMELLNTTDLSDYLDKSVDEGRNYTYWVSCSNEWGESTFAGPVSLFYIANDDDGSEKGGRSWLVYLLIVAILLAILGMAITFVMVNLRRVKADENALFVDEEGEDPGVDSGS